MYGLWTNKHSVEERLIRKRISVLIRHHLAFLLNRISGVEYGGVILSGSGCRAFGSTSSIFGVKCV